MEYYKNLDLEPIKYFCEFDLIWKIEEWRNIVGYEICYMVSDLGRVKGKNRFVFNNGSGCFNERKGILLKQGINSSGYCIVGLCINSVRKSLGVHQLVAIAFLNHIPNGLELVPNHKNFIRTDNRKLNLEIVTNRENSNKKHIQSTSKYVGVSWSNHHKKWVSNIRIKGKLKFLGLFFIEEDAAKSYNKKLEEINNE